MNEIKLLTSTVSTIILKQWWLLTPCMVILVIVATAGPVFSPAWFVVRLIFPILAGVIMGSTCEDKLGYWILCVGMLPLFAPLLGIDLELLIFSMAQLYAPDEPPFTINVEDWIDPIQTGVSRAIIWLPCVALGAWLGRISLESD